MIARRFQKGDAASIAHYSDCERYRYDLTRIWSQTGGRVVFVMLNPSTATEAQNDPTVERCERRARALGFGSFCVVNIFAWRDTDPKALRRAPEPIGVQNDHAILAAGQSADQVICAWGTHGVYLDRGPQVAQMLRQNDIALYCLGLSKMGHPKHPLYLSYQIQPFLWQ